MTAAATGAGAGAGDHNAGGSPSADGSPSAGEQVALDLGRGVGALVLYAPAALAGVEIEISQGSDPAAPRTHAVVQGRAAGPAGRTADGRTVRHDARPAIYAAVYPGLAAGTYTIWRDAATPAGTADVAGGQVTTWHWPA